MEVEAWSGVIAAGGPLVGGLIGSGVTAAFWFAQSRKENLNRVIERASAFVGAAVDLADLASAYAYSKLSTDSVELKNRRRIDRTTATS